MWWLTLGVLCGGLVTGGVAQAEQTTTENDDQAAPVSAYLPGHSIKTILVYLHKVDGRWISRRSGDLKDPGNELIELTLSNGVARVMANTRRPCLTKMKDRVEFGYLECNSAFYSVNAGSSAALTLIRGVLSLGILTAADAATGNTGFTVSLDQSALDAAILESKALELARGIAPLLDYRQHFAKASSPSQLRAFISNFENVFDPESLVAKAKEKLPAAIAQEDAQARLELVVAAKQEEASRQLKIRSQLEEEALAAFRTRLKPGDRIASSCRIYRGCQLTGMVIEMKPPLAYVQWENATPAMQWVRLDNLQRP